MFKPILNQCGTLRIVTQWLFGFVAQGKHLESSTENNVRLCCRGEAYGLWRRVKLRYSSLGQVHILGSYINSNTLNLNILEKDNIVCISLVNATMCLNSIGESNVPNLRNYT